jgi:regulator of vacuolar morphogenesis
LYEDRVDAGKPAVFYKIEVKLGKRKWELWKRYSQFDKLDADLRSKYPKLPTLPGKTFFKLKANDDIKKRREELHNYLQVS